MALNEKRNFSQILVIMTHRALTFRQNIFAVLLYLAKGYQNYAF